MLICKSAVNFYTFYLFIKVRVIYVAMQLLTTGYFCFSRDVMVLSVSGLCNVTAVGKFAGDG